MKLTGDSSLIGLLMLLKLSMMILVLFILVSVSGSKIKEMYDRFNQMSKEEKFYEETSRLAEEVWNRSFVDRGCVVFWSENDLFKSQKSQIRSKENFSNFFEESYLSNCNTYFVQVSKPERFFELWDTAREKTVHRHNPKLFFLPSSTDAEPPNVFGSLAEISADVLVAENSPDEKWPLKLYTNNFHVRTGTENRTEKIFINEWSPVFGFRYDNDLYPDKISDLMGKEVIVATFTYLPYVNTDPFDGTEARILQEYCKRHNCTIKVVDDGNLWGEVTGVREGNGVAGNVYKGAADFGIASIYPWIEFYYRMDFSSSYMYAAAAMLVPKPVLLGGWRTPFLPFSLTMWIIFVFCLILSSIGLYAITCATIKLTRYGDEIKRKGQFTSLTDSIIRSVGMSVLQQPNVAKSPVRFLFTSFQFLYLILTACYSAELASYLTVPQFTKPIDTYRELARSGLVWFADHDVWKYALVHSDHPDDVSVVKNFRTATPERLAELAPLGIHGIAIERLAFGHYTEQPHITEEAIVNSHVMAENLYASAVSVVLEKGSAYTESLSRLVNLILDGGLFIYWEEAMSRRFLTYRIQMALKSAKKTSNDKPQILTTDNVQGAFIIYSIGILLSTVAFIMEILKYKKSIRLNSSTEELLSISQVTENRLEQ